MASEATGLLERRTAQIPEAAASRGISRRTLSRWISQGDVAVFRFSRKLVLVDLASLDRFIEKHRVPEVAV